MKKVFLSGGWIESKYSTSWILAVLLITNYTFTGFLVPVEDEVFGFNPHVYDLVSSSVVALTLIASAALISKTKLSRFRQVMAVWLSAAMVSVIPVGLLIHLVSAGAETAAYFSQAATYILSILASCYVFALLTAAVAEGLSQSQELRRTHAELLVVRRKLSSELEDLAVEFSKPIGERLKSFVTRQGLFQSSSPSQIADAILEFSGEDLRSNVREISTDALARKRSGRASIIGLAATAAFTKVKFSQSLGVAGMTLVTSAYFVTSFWLLAGVAASISVALSLALAIGLWVLFAGLVNDQNGRWWVWSLVNGGIYFVSLNSTSLFAQILETNIDSGLVLTTSGMTAVLAVVLSSLESLVVRRKLLQETLLEWNDSLTESSMRLSQRLNLVRSNVAKHLHNNIQSQLVALGLKLKSQGDEWTAEGITRNEALDSLSKISEGVELTELKVKSFGSSLAELKEFWDGALEISIQLEKEAEQLLSASVELSGRMLNVLRQCLTNAAKHSLDGTVRLLIVEDAGTVQLRSINRIAENSNSSEPTGLGTKTIEDATSSWQATVRDGEYVFEARF